MRIVSLPALLAALVVGIGTANVGHAQDTQPLVGVRLSVPLGLMAEGGMLWKHVDEPEGMFGPAVTAAVGTGGVQLGAGYRLIGMMGMNGAVQALVAHTFGYPAGAPKGQLYVGGEARGGILFGSLGVGLLVRVAGSPPRGAPVRLAVSVGVGL
jgi:hypothetical protein